MAKSGRLSLAPVMVNHGHGRPPWTVTEFRHKKLPLQWLILFSHLSWVFDDEVLGHIFLEGFWQILGEGLIWI